MKTRPTLQQVTDGARRGILLSFNNLLRSQNKVVYRPILPVERAIRSAPVYSFLFILTVLFLTNYPTMYPIDLHQIYLFLFKINVAKGGERHLHATVGRHISAHDRSDLRFPYAQGTLLWLPVLAPYRRNRPTPTTFVGFTLPKRLGVSQRRCVNSSDYLSTSDRNLVTPPSSNL